MDKVEMWIKKLEEIREIESDAQLVAQLIGAIEAERAFAYVTAFKPKIAENNKQLKQTFTEYFEKVAYPLDALSLERKARMEVIKERLENDYEAHPELHKAAEILEKTTEYPDGNRWWKATPEDTLRMLKHWENPPSLGQRIKNVFKPNT
jgi:hypothetical protein